MVSAYMGETPSSDNAVWLMGSSSVIGSLLSLLPVSSISYFDAIALISSPGIWLICG